MSSFVIEKAEYIKAAGAIAGIIEGSNYGIREVFVYDYQNHRRMEDKDFYNRFVECFEMNSLSVQEQYTDGDRYTDSNDYMDLFFEYKNVGKKSAYDDCKLREIIFNLRDFLRSAEYQVEKEAYFFKMKMLFNEILVALMGLLYPHECECWGNFNPGF